MNPYRFRLDLRPNGCSQRDCTEEFLVSATTFSFILENLMPFKSYQFGVRAENQIGAAIEQVWLNFTTDSARKLHFKTTN